MITKRTTIIIKIITTAAVIASAVCFLSSCDNNVLYHSYHPINNGEWSKAEGLYFDIVPTHYKGRCKSFVVIRTDERYPYKNLSLFVQSTLKGHTSTKRIDFNLTGVKNHGIRHNDYIMPLRDFNTTDNDTIHVRISHNMHCDKISGITDVGIKINKDR